MRYLGSMLLCGSMVSLWGALGADELLRYLKEPRIRAFLDVIAFAEGTQGRMKRIADASSDLVDYQHIFGGDTFASFDDHPRRIICAKSNGSWICSSAAGRYQLGEKTWDYYMYVRKINRLYGDTCFSPLNQDRVALQIMIDSKALPELLEESADFDAIIYRLNKKWASFPNAPYGQPTRYSLRDLKKIFDKRLRVYQQVIGRQELV